jgi:outer membrane protein OmpA-like peptidoglycan-associated protein
MDTHKKLAITFVFSLFCTIGLSGFNTTTPPDNKIVRKADNLFIFCDYKDALPAYQKLLESNPENGLFNYRLAVCYFYSSTDVLKCIPLFEKARTILNKDDEEAADLNYYLGTAYRMINRFDDAIECFTHLKSLIIPDKEGTEFIKELDQEIINCNTGKILISKPIAVSITNLGPLVNSEFPDYSPVISKDESMLLFTSKRKECTGGRTDEEGNYYEDIFVCRKEKNYPWQSSVRLDTSFITKRNLQLFNFSKTKNDRSINTKRHDASVALSPDGKQLYIYRLDDLWVSDLNNNTWEKPTRLNHFINTKKSHEPSLSLSMDEKTLYFVSERPGGYGGKDIYKSEKQNDGTWGEPSNLGAIINTEYDEDAPFIDPDDKTLYFSSQAHGSMGGFDIYKTKLQNGNWTIPENMGYPVNSGADDIFFVFNSSEKTGYFSSIREGGIGNFDIYKLEYQDKNQIAEAGLNEETEVQYAKLNAGSEKLSGGTEMLFHNSLSKLIQKSNTNSSESFPENNLINSVDKLNVSAVLYEFNKTELNADNIFELNKAYEYLKSNPDDTLIITGYADSKGNEAYNLKLSAERSYKAKKYLISKGIGENRIITIGKGEANPLFPNENSDGTDNQVGRKFNRRIEFEIKKVNDKYR